MSKFIYLGRRPSLSPLHSPDVLADVYVVDLKLSIIAIRHARNHGEQRIGKSVFILRVKLEPEPSSSHESNSSQAKNF
jgi:hypothetical protein